MDQCSGDRESIECVHLPSYNQVGVPLTELCVQLNVSHIKRFRNYPFPYPLPRQTVPMPNSFTLVAFAHQQHDGSGKWPAHAENWYGNDIRKPATLTALFCSYHSFWDHECTKPHNAPDRGSHQKRATICFVVHTGCFVSVCSSKNPQGFKEVQGNPSPYCCQCWKAVATRSHGLSDVFKIVAADEDRESFQKLLPTSLQSFVIV